MIGSFQIGGRLGRQIPGPQGGWTYPLEHTDASEGLWRWVKGELFDKLISKAKNSPS